jgi:lipopolysaccharide biosynthesis glycosyltransferase
MEKPLSSLARPSKKRLAVCLSVTSDLAFAAAVVIKNFVDLHGADDTSFFLYSDGNCTDVKTALTKAGIEVEVVKYKPPVNWFELWSSRAVAYFSPLVLAKFEVFSHLEDHKSCLWLDYDIVIQSPLSEILETDSIDIAFMTNSNSMTEQFIQPPESIPDDAPGMSAGLILVNESFPNCQVATSRLYSLYRLHSRNLYMPEQAIFDLFLLGKEFQFLALPKSKYCVPPNSFESDTAVIIHSSGPNKFWNSINNEDWESRGSELRGLGLSSFSKTKNNHTRFFRKVRFLLANLALLDLRNLLTKRV